MSRIPRVIGQKIRPLRVGELIAHMAMVPVRSTSIPPRDRLAALRKGRETQESARRLAAVFADLDREVS